jgi:acyl transferase domain-containing protein
MNGRVDQLSEVKRALLDLKEVRGRLDELKRSRNEPIAIIGMGCRFPGNCNDPESFWRLLRDGGDTVREVPPSRWDIDAYYDPNPEVQGKMYTRYGSFLENVDRFDAQFFGISPREAVSMDPQQRMLLEVSWEALEQAGQSPARLKGSQAGVFIGITNNDYVRLLELAGAERIDAYHLTGTPLNFASGRLSYVFGLHGPSMAIDTACSSSLVAVHLACQSLRAGDCNLALAGGVNLVLSASGYVIACRARMMARDGRCKTFDAAADGFVRGEGCGIIVLKRLTEALAARDNILAVIRGSAVNQDGYSSGLTVPNRSAQEAVIRKALDSASIPPAEVGYVEAHGTGTPLGDPIELRALSAVLGEGRAPDRPFVVGSVKTNIGHLESAAGIAGLIKVVLMLQHGEIPPHLHFERPNPNLDWAALPLRVPTSVIPWSRGSRRVASISSFGGSGTNSHLVLEEPPPRTSVESELRSHLLTLSAKSEQALDELVARYDCFLAATKESLADICYTAGGGRAHFPCRLAVAAGTVDQARQRLAIAARSHAPSRRPQAKPDLPAERLAADYLEGADIDWDALGRDRHKIALPTYPFQRESYWVDTSNRETPAPFIAGRTSGVHPVLGHRLESALSEMVFERHIAADSPSLLADHRVYGTVVVPGAYYISLLLSAARELFGGVAHQVRDVIFSQPLLIPDRQSRRLQAILRRSDSESAAFQIFSRDAAAADSLPWTLHAAGHVGVEKQTAAAEMIALSCDGRSVGLGLFYSLLWDSGIQLGSAFRWVEEIWKREGESLGRMRFPAGPAESRDYVLHPGLIDSCFQVLAAALPEERFGSTVYLPLGVGAFRIFRSLPARIWCSARLKEPFSPNAETSTGSLRLLDENGVLVGAVDDLAVKRAPRETLLRGTPKPGDGWLYQLQWEPVPRVEAAGEPASPGSWLIFGDHTGVGDALCQIIHQRGGKCVLGVPDAARPEEHNSLMAEAIARLGAGPRGVVHLGALDDADPRLPVSCAGALHLVQAIVSARLERPPRLWMVTRNAQTLPGDTAPPDLAGAPLWGLGRVVASEHPDLRPGLIDLEETCGPQAVADQIFDEITRPDAENQIALRAGARFALRLAPRSESSGAAVDEPVQLEIASRGTLDNLHYRPGCRRSPGPDEIEIRVHATGLNFRDVLNALGMYPGNPGPLGGECAGVVADVGEHVREFVVGDEVVAVAPGSFGAFVMTPAVLAVRKPARMSFEEAAALPMAFLTAEYALHRLAGMTSGDRVLIHAAAGGVGIAAVRLAQSCGAEIFATAGSDAKRDFLRSLGVQHVMDSRSLSFASEIQVITAGRGVDIVLNSLAGDFIPKSLEVVAAGGRFLELGKREIWSAAQMHTARPDVVYHTVALDRMILDEPARLGALFRGVMERIENGLLQPIPIRVFPAAEVQSAFRHMALTRHIGKVVVTRASTVIRPDATYVITGGVGALGLRVTEWMAGRGARHIVLTGRGEPSPDSRTRIQKIRRSGAQIVIERADAASPEQMSALFEKLAATLPPVRGLVHAAGVLDDGILLRQDWHCFRRVLAPKVAGAWNLHCCTQGQALDFFVLFSSGASLLGPPGQGNYAAANAFLDALAHYRRARGLPALSINWGPWRESGMAARLETAAADRIQSKALGSIPPDAGIAILERLLAGVAPQVAVLPLNAAGLRGSPLANLLNKKDAPPPAPHAESDFARRLQTVPVQDREALVAAHVREEVMKVLGMNSSNAFDPKQSFLEMGMDSLMAVEMRNRLQVSLEMYLPSTLVFDYPNAESMVAYLLSQMAAPEAEQGPNARTAELEALPEDQIEELLLRKLDSLEARSGV